MAKLYITEFKDAAFQPQDKTARIAAAPLPSLGTQVVTYTTTSVQSVAFSDNTRFVRVQADTDTCIRGGLNPTAVTTDMRLTAGVPEYFGVNPGDKIAAISA